MQLWFAFQNCWVHTAEERRQRHGGWKTWQGREKVSSHDKSNWFRRMPVLAMQNVVWVKHRGVIETSNSNMLLSLYRSACVSWHLRLRTRGLFGAVFMCYLLPCPCWHHLAQCHSYLGEDARVSGVSVNGVFVMQLNCFLGPNSLVLQPGDWLKWLLYGEFL